MTLVPSEEGDFSTPLRFGRNDGDGGSVFIICAPERGNNSQHFAHRFAQGPPIGGRDSDGVPLQCSTLYTLLPHISHFPSRGNERYEGKNSESYTSGTISVFFPFGGWRHHLSPLFEGALWVLSNGAMSLQESIERFILSPGWGKVRRSRIRGSRVAANHQNANQAL